MQDHPHPEGHHGEPAGHVITRRQALKLFSAPVILGLAGCSAAAEDVGEGPLTGSCVVRPQLTEGPYYLDADLVRSDIRAGREGALLALAFNVQRIASNECQALEGAVVDVWHTDALGNYSGVGSLQGETFLRGIQRTDANGDAAFTTVYPGWYRGRTPHIHFKVRSSDDSASAYAFTSQLFFDDVLSERIYTSVAPYTARGVMDRTNAQDGIYARGGQELLLDVAETDEGYAATFNIALYVE